ncbi:hypothetical protein Nepgr_020246 [Nepenthes gracilis]|uniref:DUF4005 domain-containing protein n=1 Tax=Nepenthes gracilis TaxID=150966 RepID=A0AAD3XW03_NEPGR|nr:hypothetical protein Nepgr_020246 [Nepenthes gracilis]
MGRTPHWLSKLLGRKNKRHNSQEAATADSRSQGLCTDPSYDGGGGNVDPREQAMAVAAATAAVAEAALMAAKAAEAVVRLTSGGRGRPRVEHGSGGGRPWSLENLAAVKIQSAFRGYLARRALRALRGLVKLQALVRGYIVRKRSADILRQMQAMVRLQARARANRAQNSEFSYLDLQSVKNEIQRPVRSNTKNHDHSIQPRCGVLSNMRVTRRSEQTQLGTTWFEDWSGQGSLEVKFTDVEKNDKVVEVDSRRARSSPEGTNRIHISTKDCYDHSFATSDNLANYLSTNPQRSNASPFSDVGVSPLRSLCFPLEVCSVEDSPQAYSILSRPGSSSRGSRSFGTSCMASHPSYMADTKSSQAKVRSHSTPRQRLDFEKPHSTRRFTYAFPNTTSHSRSSDSDPRTNSMRKPCSGSGHPDRLAIPFHDALTTVGGSKDSTWFKFYRSIS